MPASVCVCVCVCSYALQLARRGWVEACRQNRELKKGLNIVNGKVVHKGVHQDYPKYAYVDVNDMLKAN
jgi:alanine dehydrogenase